MITLFLLAICVGLGCNASLNAQSHIFHAQGEMTGEVTSTSAILQTRLTATDQPLDGDVPGANGMGRFEYSEQQDFSTSQTTPWQAADAKDDFILKAYINDLHPNTRYYYRLIFGPEPSTGQTGKTCSFRTLAGRDSEQQVSFVVVTGMNYVAFHYGKAKNGKRTGEDAYTGPDKQLGYPALQTMLEMKPDFFVGTGDNVYYDSHDDMEAVDIIGMRRKWHEQFVQPRFVELFRHVPTYWEKDDHDHRYNDCDRAGDRPPDSDLGIRIFREQVPVVDPLRPNSKTYRTYRVNRHLQIWLVEGRDFRSPNGMPDGPDKTLWGAEQIAWLKQTLLDSDATFKLLISPTPMVGPDDAYKIDNHTNPRGFRHEGREFFRWIKQQQLDRQGFYVICGDRHWQYHSMDPTGIEEFSCGALCDANSRIGRSPGDPKSTDPEAEIQQIYTQTEASGGFLRVTVTADALARFDFFDEHGVLLHRSEKRRDDDLSVLDGRGQNLLHDHLMGKIRAQYDARRAAVKTALRSLQGLTQRQQALRAALKRIVGELPDKTPLNPQVTGTIDGDGFRIEKVVYQSRPHHYVTANLYLPTKGTPPFPATLIACGHSSQGKAYDSYQRIAMLMAKQGLVALVYDPIGQGERLSFLDAPSNAGLQHKLANVNSVLVGRTAVGYEAWDGIRSIDYLLSRPEVDLTKPIGMTGNSGGGAQTMYLMALDDRIGPAAPSCHITTLERNFELGGAGDGCQSAPFTGAEGIEHPDFFTMRAPRPSIILAAEQDFKDIRFTRVTFRECQDVFRLLGRPEHVDMFAFDDTHSFSQPRREAAVAWMRRWLLDDVTPVTEPELAVLPEHELQVTKTGQVLTEFADAMSVADLNLQRAQELESSRQHFWQQTPAAILGDIYDLIGLAPQAGPPEVVHCGIVNRGDYRVEKLILYRADPDELPIPALRFRPHVLNGQHPATLYVDGRGKVSDAYADGPIEQRVAAGQIVLSLDLRGFGETAMPASDVVYDAGDHRAAMLSMHIGKSLLGQRAEEVVAALNLLSEDPHVNHRDITLVGLGLAGPVALHVAPMVSQTDLRDSSNSWLTDVLARPLEINSISNVVPGALFKYDLADLTTIVDDKRFRTWDVSSEQSVDP